MGHEPFGALPDPGGARTLDDLTDRLRRLKIWAGNPSYESIKNRINAAWSAAGRPPGELTKKPTVADCFKPGRRRLNTDLVIAVVQVLHPDPGYVLHWQQALRVVTGEIQAAAQVRGQNSLPLESFPFVSRDAELSRLRQTVQAHADGAGRATVVTVVGLAGVGKTRLAVRFGHQMLDDGFFDRVLFVDLRGFHPDPAQPPAEPVAVLGSFLLLLGVPAREIPHGNEARVSRYRQETAGRRTLVVLDNAVDDHQTAQLLPYTAGTLTVITSRQSLTRVPADVRLVLDVFTPDQAAAFLAGAVPGKAVGEDREATVRIAAQCGHLPLALALLAGHIRATPGWTLSDHADRLEQRHRDRKLEVGVERALALSYRHLPAKRQRMFRLLALHPGPDIDAYAAAAIAGTSLGTARDHLLRLAGEHLVKEGMPGRFTLHDLVAVYGVDRAGDEEPPAERRAAVTRLLDFYLAAASAAMDLVHPADAHRRPRPPVCATPLPQLTTAKAARAWLDAERPCLTTAAGYAADHSWPVHAVGFSASLASYLAGGRYDDALTIHSRAVLAGRAVSDVAGEARALLALGSVHYRLGHHESAAEHGRAALTLFRRMADPLGEAEALDTLGYVARRQGAFHAAARRHRQALALYRQIGDVLGEADALTGLGTVQQRLGRGDQATANLEQAVNLYQRLGDKQGEATALNNLGLIEQRLHRLHDSSGHLERALRLFRSLGNPRGEGSSLDSLGILHTSLGRPESAAEHHRQALAIFRSIGARDSESWALNGLGEASAAVDRAEAAIDWHTAAHTVAAEIGAKDQCVRAYAGLGRVHEAMNRPGRAREAYHQALALEGDSDSATAKDLNRRLAALND